jgi:hypothetical protein
MKLASHIIALSVPHSDPIQIAAALTISLAYFKKLIPDGIVLSAPNTLIRL